MIGIFGGAFDPPHKQHVKIVRGIMDEFDLEKAVILPSGQSPHKDLTTPYALRSAMVRAAFRGDRFLVDDLEATYDGRAYSSDILPILKEKYGEILFIIGGDSLLHFESWHEPAAVAKACPIAVVPRGDEDISLLREIAARLNEKFGGDFRVSNAVRGDRVSSTALRAAIELGLESDEIDPDVRRIAEENDLYNAHRAMIDRVRASLPEKRWDHTRGVVMAGLEINERVGLPSEQVFVACLLHDCMKYAETVHAGVPEDTIGTKVMHAFNGAEEAKVGYGVRDEDVVNAIRYHTTGRAGMSTLEKLVYVADMIEPHRDFEGVEELRADTLRDLDAGFRMCIERSYELLQKRGKPIYHLTVECYNAYCKGEKDGK